MTARKKARLAGGRKPKRKTPKKRRAVTKKGPAGRSSAVRRTVKVRRSTSKKSAPKVRSASPKKRSPKMRTGGSPKKPARGRGYPPRPLTRPVRPAGILKREGIREFRKRLGRELARASAITHEYAKKLRKKTRAVKKSGESVAKKKRRLAGLKGYATRLGRDRSGYRLTLEQKLTGKLGASEQHFIRREMMRTEHPIFTSFIEDMLDLGWDYHDAIDEWFSPEGE